MGSRMRFAYDRSVITFEVTTLGRTGRIDTKTVTHRCPLNHLQPTRVPPPGPGEAAPRPVCLSSSARGALPNAGSGDSRIEWTEHLSAGQATQPGGSSEQRKGYRELERAASGTPGALTSAICSMPMTRLSNSHRDRRPVARRSFAIQHFDNRPD